MLVEESNMAARSARSFWQNGTKSFALFSRVSGVPIKRFESAETVLFITPGSAKSLYKASSACVQVNPALSGLLQGLTKHSFPSFQKHVRIVQDLAVNADATLSILSTNNGNSQDMSLEQCTDDDDDQFRTRDVLSKAKDEIEMTGLVGNTFAIVYIGGSQFKVSVNDVVMVNKLNADLGSRIRLEKVLLVGGENFTLVGQPLINKNVVNVEATLIENSKTEKVIVFKKKRRKGYKRTQGHRQEMSILRINKIDINSKSLS